jgi:hypothetical protein
MVCTKPSISAGSWTVPSEYVTVEWGRVQIMPSREIQGVQESIM